MDSPVRQYLKLKDYQRHKLFRKIRRRRKAEAQQAIDAPMKELRRRLKRYGDGKNVPMNRSIDGVNLWRDDQTGQYFYQEANGPRIDLTPFNTLGSDDPTTWSFLDAEGKEYNPRRLYTGPEISQTTDAQRIANEVRDILNTRTWRSDVADLLHNFGDALMWSTMAMNPEGEALMTKALEKAASLRKLVKPTFNKAALAVENYRYPFGRPQVPEGYITVKPQIRTRIGDVEIDNPNLLYHLDRGDSAGAFSNQGAYVKDGRLLPGIAKEGEIPYSWWNLGRPYATSVNGQPMTRLMTTTKDTPGMLHIRSQNYPIGQWNGKRGLVTNAEYVNPEGVSVSESTYTLDPDYGWRRVFTEDAPTAKWADAVKTPQITAENAALLLQLQSKRLGGDLKYGTPNLFEKYIYGRKINGLSVDPFDIAKLPYSDAINELWSKDVAIGLSADAKQSLLDETIARNVRAFEEQGVDPLAILEYRNRAAALMDDVRVGRYTNQDYIKAGKDDIGGFYDGKRNFLSVNTESGFPDGFVEKHEGRHLLDYKLDDDILMGTNAYRNNLGSDFDSDATAKAMRMAVLKQNDVLTKAYDMDFVNLPNTKYAGSLKGYPHMERETVTTNADSRRILFDKKHANNWSLELKDKLIDKVPKEDIFDAVELANGYGRRYILFLRDNGKLTEEKANLFREAMKYKGILAVPMAVGAGYGLIGGSNDITFNKGKDDWLHSLLKTYWGGELPEVKVTARDLRKPQTFAGRIAQAAGASPAVSRGADLVSTAVLLTPYGIIPAALDLGMDSNSLYHGDERAEKDVALDLLSMIPGISKLGLKKTPTRTLKQMWDEALQAYRELVKFLSGVGKAGDAIDDTYGSVNVMSHFDKGKNSGIHIKPLNRGKFTALKKRTGKSASWFKAHGTPALKKMATFALNARKWKHK